jgi:hypothetical protein
MFNGPQDDLLDLFRQAVENAKKEKRSAVHIEEDDNPRGDTFKLFVYVDGHDLWKVGLNKDHGRESCAECCKDK